MSVGKIAKSVKGMANASANPNIPTAGPTQLPDVTVSTSSKPIIGAVQEKLTSTSVKAMRNMESRPVALLALESTELAQLSGSLISNQPKKLTAKTTRDRKSTRLNSSHANISYAVFCLKKKKNNHY